MGDRADADRGEATRLLSQWRSGDADARERLLAITYDQLRSLARRLMRGERAGHTLQPTGLVNEACLRLLGDDGLPARDRREFLALAAHGMRRVLVDSARRRRAGKRGSDEWRQVSLADGMGSHPAEGDLVDVLALHAALEKLATLSERQARVAELRAFGGLTLAETAETLGVGTTVVKAEWQVARAWLRRELARDTPDPEPPADTEPR